jgi:sugar/nucleoside kinase (ribokinase family)
MIIKCNDKEAARIFHPELGGKDREAPKPSRDELEVYLKEFYEINGKEIFITCGAAGVLVRTGEGKGTLLPALPVPPPIDIVGAGDACTSGIVSTLSMGGSAEEAAFVGNLVSSITIQVIGTTGTATPGQVLNRFEEYFEEDGTPKFEAPE